MDFQDVMLRHSILPGDHQDEPTERLTAVESSWEMMRSKSTGSDVSSSLLGDAGLSGRASGAVHEGKR